MVSLFSILLGGGWGAKGILEFRFGPSLGLRLEPRTKLNNLHHTCLLPRWVSGVGVLDNNDNDYLLVDNRV